MSRVSNDELVRKLQLGSVNSKEYTEHVRSVKFEFIRRDHIELLPGPHALRAKGDHLTWETGLNLLYQAYEDVWAEDRFADRAERRAYAHFFLVAQTKKARADIAGEEKKAEAKATEAKEKEEKEAKAKKAREAKANLRREPELKGQFGEGSSPTFAGTQKARGRKRLRNDSDPRYSSPHRLPSLVRYSSATVRSSLARDSPSPPPKRQRWVERPNLKFRSFVVLMKTGGRFAQASYDSLWEFEELVKWILAKKPTLAGQQILCWVNVTIRDSEWAELREHQLDEKVPCFVTDQSSWDAAVMAAQANRINPDDFTAIRVDIASATDPDAPPHTGDDAFLLTEDGEVPQRQGNEENFGAEADDAVGGEGLPGDSAVLGGKGASEAHGGDSAVAGPGANKKEASQNSGGSVERRGGIMELPGDQPKGSEDAIVADKPPLAAAVQPTSSKHS